MADNCKFLILLNSDEDKQIIEVGQFTAASIHNPETKNKIRGRSFNHILVIDMPIGKLEVEERELYSAMQNCVRACDGAIISCGVNPNVGR